MLSVSTFLKPGCVNAKKDLWSEDNLCGPCLESTTAVDADKWRMKGTPHTGCGVCDGIWLPILGDF